MSRHTPQSRPVVTLAAALITIAALAFVRPAGATDANGWPYIWPVGAPISDPFRAPTNRFAAGNRGIEFRTIPGQVVVAAREGIVTFAGQVAGSLFVTIIHPDGVRTSYGHVATVGVLVDQSVAIGEPIATTAGLLHVSARIGDAYVDPSILFGGAHGPARLIARDGLGQVPIHSSPGAEVRCLIHIQPSTGTNPRSRLARRSQCSATAG